MSWFSIIDTDDGYRWALYAGNNHLVMMSERVFRRPHHARAAARRLYRIVNKASFNYGRGFKDPKGRKLRP